MSMSQSDIDYISDGFLELYSAFGINLPMKYIPVDTVNTHNDKSGRLVLAFLESKAITTYGKYLNDDYKDRDVTNEGDARINASIQFVMKPFRTAGITPQLKDAVDITDSLGNTRRFIVTGFSKVAELNEVFFQVYVTDKTHAFVT